MSGAEAEPKLLRPQTRVRYLKIIALYKIAKGMLLLVLGGSILFLNTRDAWLDQISDWAGDEILLKHSKAVLYLLHRLQDALAGGALRATGLLALVFAALFLTEGIGVYLQKRWAEFLMVFATAAFIPLEIRHVAHRPSVAAIGILAANCFIVWFLSRVLRRGPSPANPPQANVPVETHYHPSPK